jgi:hypothetical protein
MQVCSSTSEYFKTVELTLKVDIIIISILLSLFFFSTSYLIVKAVLRVRNVQLAMTYRLSSVSSVDEKV